MGLEFHTSTYLNNCITGIFACFLLSFLYVLSLYVWSTPHNRDHPYTIKRRFISVLIMMFISPFFVYFFSSCDKILKHSFMDLLGLRLSGFLLAATIPLLLTMVLFLGPLIMQCQSGLWSLYAEPMYWLSNFKNLIWLRNHIIAPASEEFTFRACMLPLLIQCFRPQSAIFICPLFFGTAHLHHIIGRVSEGADLKSAILGTGFQFIYTTLFGAYSAFLFLRTGHFVSPFLAHAFCNHMGFPQFTDLLNYKEPKRSLIVLSCIIGLILWCILLAPLTNPSWYDNSIFWRL